MSRFFVDPASIGEKYIYIDDKNDVKHILSVLRMKKGDTLTVSYKSEWEYECEISGIEDGQICLLITDKQRFASEPDLRVTLFQGVPKGSKMDDIVRKTTEMGIARIVPVFMDRTVVKDNGTYHKKIARMQQIAGEASKQCGRGVIPEISDKLSFAEMISLLDNYDVVVFPYENEKGTTIKDALRDICIASDRVMKNGRKSKKQTALKTCAVIIGPEGGFSDTEAEELKKTDALCVTLGKTILRTETAGIVTMAMIMYELEL